MSYLEEQQGIPHSRYSADLLELDQKSGPWLAARQQQSVVDLSTFPRWDLDPENKLIYFGDDERVGLVARYEVLGTYDPADGVWLWAWANPKLEAEAGRLAELAKAQSDVPELTEPSSTGTETRAWTLAAVVGFLMEAETCFRIPGEIQTFVALFEPKELDPDDPRARREEPEPDAEAAQKVLADYAGPMALNLGGMLLDAVRTDELPLEQVLAAWHGFCDNLEQLAQSPIGTGTPAAAEALQLADVLRKGAVCLSVPRENPAFLEGVQEVLALLRDLAQHYGAWEAGEEQRGEEETR